MICPAGGGGGSQAAIQMVNEMSRVGPTVSGVTQPRYKVIPKPHSAVK